MLYFHIYAEVKNNSQKRIEVNYQKYIIIQSWSESLRIWCINDILQKMYSEIKECKGRGISKLYMRHFEIARRTMYGWLNGTSPITVFHLMKFIKLWKNSCEKSNEEEAKIIKSVFSHSLYFSVEKGRKIKLPTDITADLAYLIGYVIGDGCLSGKNLIKRSQFRIRIASDTKKFLNQIINPLFHQLFSIKGRIYKITNSQCYELSVQSKVLYLFLNKICDIPIGKKKGKLTIPTIISKGSKKIKFAFISGFFDADGCIYEKQKAIIFAQADRKFLTMLRRLLNNLNINMRPIYTKRKELGTTYECSVRFNSLKNFLDNAQFAHQNRIKRANNLRNIIMANSF